MQISGYGAVNQTQWPYDQQRRTRAATENTERRGDTVSFSAEALELLARSQAARNDADAKADATESAASKDTNEKSDAAATAKSSVSIADKTGTSSGSFGDTAGEQAEERAQSSSTHQSNAQAAESTDADIDAKIKGLKGQIEQVARQIANVYKLPLDTPQKVEMAHPLEERIEQLQQEIQVLEAQKAAQASEQKQG